MSVCFVRKNWKAWTQEESYTEYDSAPLERALRAKVALAQWGLVFRSFVTAPAGGGGTARKISVVPGATVLPALENAAKPPAPADEKSPPILLPPLAEITVAVGAHGAMAGKQTVAA